MELDGHASSSWDGEATHAETLADFVVGKRWIRVNGRVQAAPRAGTT